MVIVAYMVRPGAKCPGCGKMSTQIHSRYECRLLDTPHGSQMVVIRLTVRRFFCSESTCPTKTFTEHIPGICQPYGRRTIKANEILTKLGLRMGGEAGARMAHDLRVPVSADTLIRLILSSTLSEQPTPKVLGVDD